MTVQFPCNEPNLLIDGPVGPLEIATACPAGVRRRGLVILCHPHPLHGGTMDNKVVTTTARAMLDLGFVTVRFNFRGAGNSIGRFAGGTGEAEDLVAVAAWARTRLPEGELWLAGFSFGAGVALRAAQTVSAARLLLIAPAIHLHGFGELMPPQVPILVVQGTADEIVPLARTRAWIEARAPWAELRTLPKVGHFLHGALKELRALLKDAVGAAS